MYSLKLAFMKLIAVNSPNYFLQEVTVTVEVTVEVNDVEPSHEVTPVGFAFLGLPLKNAPTQVLHSNVEAFQPLPKCVTFCVPQGSRKCDFRILHLS